MRLLTSSQVKEVKSRQEFEKVKRLKDLDDLILQKTKALEALNYDEEKLRLQKEFNVFVADMQTKRTKLLSDIEVLQTKRNTLSTPLAGWEKELSEREAQLRLQRLALESQHLDAAALKEKLLSADQAFSYLKDNFANREAELLRKEKDLKSKTVEVEQSNSELARKWKEFEQASTDFASELKLRTEQLAQREVTVESLRLTLESELKGIEQLRAKKLKEVDEKLSEALRLAKSTDIQREVIEAKQQTIDQLQSDITELRSSIKKKSDSLSKQEQDLLKKQEALKVEYRKLEEDKAFLIHDTQVHKQQRDNLRKEVLSLETRKLEALKPVEQTIKELKLKEVELEKNRTAIEAQTQSLAKDANKLHKQKQKLNELETSLNNESVALKEKDARLQKLQESLLFDHERFMVYERETKEQHTLKAQELKQKELDLNSQIKAYHTLKNELDKQFEILEQDRLKLQDERATLDAAWNELRMKQHGTS